MPKHRALENCFIDNCYRREGDVFEYSGPPCAVLEPLEKTAHVDDADTAEGPRLRRKSKASASE
jgi:hypothetical protein